ncbi:MAG: HlyD family efflux transporter periplasmic adaptor subunit [Planctomycetes bacterium]|nr:HlyD family efflux transporter periplasmic adaptor subunit [Planctomycetota bacterium]
MSSTDSIQNIRERVLKMAQKIEGLSRSRIPPEEFFPEFLKLLVGALGAQAGVVWMRDENNRLSLSHELMLAETGFRDNPQASSLNQQLLTNVMATGEASSYSPQDETDVKLPTNNLHVLAALQVDNDGVGVVQIFQRPDAPVDARAGFLQFVEQMCGYASRYMERRQTAQTAGTPAEFWKEFEQFTLEMQRSLDVKEVASTVVNDARLLLACDRLSVLIKRGKKVSVEAISGQDAVNPRANLVQSMVALASTSMSMRDSVLFTGRVDHLAPQIEVALANFVQESGSRMVMVVPLFEYDPLVSRDDDDQKNQQKKDEPRKVIGCLVIEQVSKSEPEPGLLDRVDLVADHVAAALHNARLQQQIFLLRFWRFLGRSLEWFRGRKLAKTAAVLAGLTMIGMGLVLIPMDYRVEGKGQLMPVTQQAVFAQVDGEVEEISVKDGERVKAGQELLQLRNNPLKLELTESESLLVLAIEDESSLSAKIDTARRLDEKTRFRGEREQVRIRIDALKIRNANLQERVEKLTVRAPIAGVVVTFRLEQLLKDRPVRRGETLMEVMDDTGEWHVELEVAEKRMGHILRAQEKLKTLNLSVEFVPATSSVDKYEGKLQEIATRSESSEEGSVVEVIVSIDKSKLPNLRIGAEVSAKINCGERSAGYVFFGDVIEAAQRYFFVWF